MLLELISIIPRSINLNIDLMTRYLQRLESSVHLTFVREQIVTKPKEHSIALESPNSTSVRKP